MQVLIFMNILPVLPVWPEIYVIITSDLESLSPNYCSIYMYVWQILITAWIILACGAKTMKECKLGRVQQFYQESSDQFW